MLSWNLRLLDITACMFFMNTLGLFVTHESTKRVTFMGGGSISTTLNTKLSAQIALCVWAEWWRVTLQQGVDRARTIPLGRCFRASAWAPHTGECVFCYSKQTVRKRTSDSRAEFAFHKRRSEESHAAPFSALVAVGVTQSDINMREDWLRRGECFRDPLCSHLLGVYLVSDAATGRLEMDCWCNKPKNQCSFLIPSRWNL